MKRKGDNYGGRKGQSLVGKYRRGRFIVWHCKDAFEAGKDCVDGVCGQCKVECTNDGHSCGICGQNIGDYKAEDNQGMMPRNRKNWPGPGPEECVICGIEL